jgi:microcystin-dependent protein
MYTFSPNTVINSSKINANFEEVQADIATTPPIGSLIPYAGSAAPDGWLLADGAEVSRTTYSDLFAVIGTTYGAGDGSTTFALPSLEGKTVVGIDTAQTEFDTLGETGGAKTHTLTAAEMPAHTHAIGSIYGLGLNPATASNRTNLAAGSSVVYQAADTYSAGSGNAHNNLQPYIALNYLIRY